MTFIPVLAGKHPCPGHLACVSIQNLLPPLRAITSRCSYSTPFASGPGTLFLANNHTRVRSNSVRKVERINIQLQGTSGSSLPTIGPRRVASHRKIEPDQAVMADRRSQDGIKMFAITQNALTMCRNLPFLFPMSSLSNVAARDPFPIRSGSNPHLRVRSDWLCTLQQHVPGQRSRCYWADP